MLTNEIVEVAGIISLQESAEAVKIAQLPEKAQLERIYQYWMANRQRFQSWESALDKLDAAYYSSVNLLPEGLFEEIIAGELLSSLACSWFERLDQIICAEGGIPVFSSIGKNVLEAHEAIILRVFSFLLKRETRSTHFRTVWYNQLRLTTRHWKRSLGRYMADSLADPLAVSLPDSLPDSLAGSFEKDGSEELLDSLQENDFNEYTVSIPLSEESAADSQTPWNAEASGHIAVAAPRLSWDSLQSALKVSFLLWNRQKSANPELNRQIASSVLDLIPEKGKRMLYQYPDVLEERLIDAADDLQYLVDSCCESPLQVPSLFIQRLKRYAG